MKRHIVKHHAPEIAMANSLEGIIEFCCNARKEDGKVSNDGQKNKLETRDFEFSEDFTDEESPNEENEDLVSSDEDNDVEMKIKTVENKCHIVEELKERYRNDSNVPLKVLRRSNERKAHFGSNKTESTGVQDIPLAEEQFAENEDMMEPGNEKNEQKEATESLIKCHSQKAFKRFQCKYCGKKSNWLSDIRKHIRKGHPAKEIMVIKLLGNEEREADPLPNDTLTKTSPGRKTPELDRSNDAEKLEGRDDINDNSKDDQGKYRKKEQDAKVSDIGEHSVIAENREEKEEITETKEENNNTLKIMPGSSRGKKYRPYKCSACPRRSNWRWDIMKHIRKIHPSAKMITLSEDVAKATFSESVMKRPKGQGLKAQKKLEKEKEQDFNQHDKFAESDSKWNTKQKEQNNLGSNVNSSPSVKDIKVKTKTSNTKEAGIPFKKRKLEVEGKQEKMSKPLPKKKSTIPKTVVMETIPRSPKKAKVETIRCKGSKESTKGKQSSSGIEHPNDVVKNDPNSKPILRCLKRYKCFYCPYRSNYRSDIGRHGKRLHRKQQLKVVILDEEEAASTLQDYRQKYAKKKFVLASSEAEERARRKPKQTENCNQSKNVNRPFQVVGMSESAQLNKSSQSPQSLSKEEMNLTKYHAKNSENQLSSRVLFDQSNVLTRCCELGAVACNCQRSNSSTTCQLSNGATEMRCNGENAHPD